MGDSSICLGYRVNFPKALGNTGWCKIVQPSSLQTQSWTTIEERAVKCCRRSLASRCGNDVNTQVTVESHLIPFSQQLLDNRARNLFHESTEANVEKGNTSKVKAASNIVQISGDRGHRNYHIQIPKVRKNIWSDAKIYSVCSEVKKNPKLLSCQIENRSNYQIFFDPSSSGLQ